MTTFGNIITGFGIPVPANFGKVLFVNYTTGLDGRSGLSADRAVKTLSRAYALAADGKNDVILVAGEDPIEEDAMITWSKNKIHVIGLGGYGATDQSPRIIFSAAGLAVASAPAVIKVTGWANSFTNIRVNSLGVFGTNANVCALWDAGEATVYTNCQFNKFTDLGLTAVSDVEARGDSTTWRNCKFGFDTLLQTAARPTLWIKGAGGSARMKNNYFEDCYFVCSSSDSDKVFVKIYDTNSLAFSNVMKNCIFMSALVNSISAANLDNVVDSASGLNEGTLLFVNPAFNADTLCDTGQNQDGIQVVGPTSADDAGEPFTPANS